MNPGRLTTTVSTLLVLFITLVAACNGAITQPPASPTPPITPSPTPSLAPTPTTSLTVLAGTPVPIPQEPITPEKAADIVELAAWTGDALGASHWNPGGRISVSGLAISPDNTVFIAYSGDPAIRVLGLDTGQLLRELEGHTYGITHLALSDNGEILASSEIWDTSVWVWDVATGRRLWTLGRFGVFVRDIALSADGSMLVASGDSKAFQLFSTQSGEELHHLGGGQRCQFAFSPEGTRLVSAAWDGVYLWSTATGEQLLEIEPPEKQGYYDVAFSPDGQVVALG